MDVQGSINPVRILSYAWHNREPVKGFVGMARMTPLFFQAASFLIVGEMGFRGLEFAASFVSAPLNNLIDKHIRPRLGVTGLTNWMNAIPGKLPITTILRPYGQWHNERTQDNSDLDNPVERINRVYNYTMKDLVIALAKTAVVGGLGKWGMDKLAGETPRIYNDISSLVCCIRIDPRPYSIAVHETVRAWRNYLVQISK